ncbi:PAP2 family protein [Aeromicrobium sp. SMF47]|uniref:phosphatase PAP2 family protein n=1 Tax=Aeromicrobium yanjiei TaxID=2662028 RepID=UPI00129E442D|nr:phosphatase PAP2 family protein [Aeromicrobium yanjiei]MRJ75923.1 PAP2 family protein [Aeromicrobium yanjiei]
MSTLTGQQRGPARGTPSPRGPAVSAHALRAGRRVASSTGLREVAVLAGLWVAYSISRLLVTDDLASARARAGDILHLESLLHLDFELWLSSTVGAVTQIAVPMSFWYATLHYVVTPAVLVLVFLRHRADYPRARNAIVIGSAIGLVCYVLLPTAPPRLMPGGQYLDVLAMTSTFGWWGGDASAPAGLGHLTNELAAMPSLHVGWTVWVAWAIWRHTGLVGRAIACLYVAGTTFVVIATGNHWVLDAVAGAAVVAVGIVLSGRIASRTRADDLASR